MDNIERACGINSSQNFGLKTILNLMMNVMNGKKLHVIESKKFALTSVLLPREMLSYEPEVQVNGWKFEARINI